MDLHSLQVFLTVATEKSFSRAAGKLLRTQPAISLSLQRLEQELGEKLIDRSGKDLILTDAREFTQLFARPQADRVVLRAGRRPPPTRFAWLYLPAAISREGDFTV